MIRFIQGLCDLAADYDVLLCDVWGVIHNGQDHFPGACAALARWRAKGGPVILISNSPRPSAEVIRQLDSLGVPRDSWTALVTSGDVTRTLLAARAPGPAWAIGPERDAALYEGLGLAFAGPQDAAFISCTGPIDDETETPEDYRKVFELAALRGLEMVCANPDRVVQRGPRLIYCGGALAELYEQLGGRVTMAGKPYAAIYDACLAEAERLMGHAPPKRRVLAIGDGVPTDVAGANGQGLDILFVAGGIHGGEIVRRDGTLDPAATEALLAAGGGRATYALAELAW